jgi:hypothetical protein
MQYCNFIFLLTIRRRRRFICFLFAQFFNCCFRRDCVFAVVIDAAFVLYVPASSLFCTISPIFYFPLACACRCHIPFLTIKTNHSVAESVGNAANVSQVRLALEVALSFRFCFVKLTLRTIWSCFKCFDCSVLGWSRQYSIIESVFVKLTL